MERYVMTVSKYRQYLPTFVLLLAMVLWSSSFIALKIAFRSYDPMVVIFGRMMVATLCFLVAYKRVTRLLVLKRGDVFLMVFMAFCEPCLYFVFEAKALENTTASQAGMITALMPILVMITASIFLGEKTGKTGWYGAILAVIGVLWLTVESSPTEDAPNPALGNFLEFIAMVCAAVYTLIMRFLAPKYSPLFLTAVQAFVGSVFYLPILFLPSVKLPGRIEFVPTFAIIYLGAVITLGAYGLFNYSLKHVPASRAASFVNLIPVFAVLLGWLVLGEVFTLMQCVAAAIVMGGVLLSQQSSYSNGNES
jgi:drug/metabolite transporter (DMT)-like permease